MVGGVAHGLFWRVLSWLACAIDHYEVLTQATDDSFVAPQLQGRRGRTLKVSGGYKYKVGRLASRGDQF